MNNPILFYPQSYLNKQVFTFMITLRTLLIMFVMLTGDSRTDNLFHGDGVYHSIVGVLPASTHDGRPQRTQGNS